MTADETTVYVIADVNEPGFGFETPDGDAYGAASFEEACDIARRLGFDPERAD